MAEFIDNKPKFDCNPNSALNKQVDCICKLSEVQI